MYHRIITSQLIDQCFRGKVIVVYGPRQVGKTTLVKKILASFHDKKTLFVTGDDRETQESFVPVLRALIARVQAYDLIVLDEAQRIKDIWLVLKLLVDHFPHKQFIATWSSSFDLSNSIAEPLTGRSFLHYLYPLSMEELSPDDPLTVSFLERMMLYGSYPDAINPGYLSPEEYCKKLVNDYLYKDIIAFDGIKKTQTIIKLLQALALQIGSEFSYRELADIVGVDKKTIEKYITILEQAYIITLLHPLHTNQRREIKMNKKVYFWDLGVRNALIGNFLPLSMRQDVWALWENLFCIERIKFAQYHNLGVRSYFWRWIDAGEIDLVQTKNNHYTCFECKYNPKKWWSIPPLFASHYPQHEYHIINPTTIESFVKKTQ